MRSSERSAAEGRINCRPTQSTPLRQQMHRRNLDGSLRTIPVTTACGHRTTSRRGPGTRKNFDVVPPVATCPQRFVGLSIGLGNFTQNGAKTGEGGRPPHLPCGDPCQVRQHRFGTLLSNRYAGPWDLIERPSSRCCTEAVHHHRMVGPPGRRGPPRHRSRTVGSQVPTRAR